MHMQVHWSNIQTNRTMRAIISIMVAVLLLGGCTMTDVSIENIEPSMEKSDTTSFKKHYPVKGIVIIPTTTTKS